MKIDNNAVGKLKEGKDKAKEKQPIPGKEKMIAEGKDVKGRLSADEIENKINIFRKLSQNYSIILGEK